MKCAVAVFVIFTLFVFTETAIHVVPRKSYKYDGNSTCFMTDYGEFEEGEIKKNHIRCEIIECRSGGDLNIISCGVLDVKFPCYIVENSVTLPYPQCCDKVECIHNRKLL